MIKTLLDKLKSSVFATLPVTIFILFMSFVIVDVEKSILISFAVGLTFFIVGMSLFTLGVEVSILPMGEGVGAGLQESKKPMIAIFALFVLGFVIAFAEPALQVLATQMRAIPTYTLLLTISCGVGLFVALFLIKIYLKIKLSHILIITYGIIFVLAIFAPREFLGMAFDSGGVTTGAISVPFVLALGIGLTTAKRDKDDGNSFGMVAFCTLGPVLAVMILGIFYKVDTVSAVEQVPPPSSLILGLTHESLALLKDIAIALTPIIVCFIIFQIFILKYPKSMIIRMGVGIVYTYVGLVLFLLAVNTGFLPIGRAIGSAIAIKKCNYILIPIGFVLGAVIIIAEPAIHILATQVENLTGGAISKKALIVSLIVGIATSVALSMTRVLYGVSLWYFLLPGYVIALVLSLLVKPIFTSIAFDAGGVASGPMTVAFLLPFAIGASNGIDGNIYLNAFGISAMVTMAPLITMQTFGLIYRIKLTLRKKQTIKDEDEKKLVDEKVIDFNDEPVEWNEKE